MKIFNFFDDVINGKSQFVNFIGDKVSGHSYSMIERIGNGTNSTKNISVEFFDAIVNNTILPISIKQGIGAEVKLIGDSNLFDLIEFEFSKSGNLEINMIPCNLKNSNLKIEIIVPQLDLIEINSIGSMTIQNFNFKKLEVVLNSVGSLTMTNCLIEIFNFESEGTGSFNCKNVEISNYLSVNLTGTGSFDLNGTAVIPATKLKTSGTGSIEISQFIMDCSAYSNGVGSIDVKVLDKISGSCSGIGCVNVKGSATNRNCKSGFIGKFKFN